MNLILWILSGGLMGSFFALFFANSGARVVGDLFSGLLGGILFGYISKRFVPNTRGRNLDPQSFSPASLLWAIAGAGIVLALFNVLF